MFVVKQFNLTDTNTKLKCTSSVASCLITYTKDESINIQSDYEFVVAFSHTFWILCARPAAVSCLSRSERYIYRCKIVYWSSWSRLRFRRWRELSFAGIFFVVRQLPVRFDAKNWLARRWVRWLLWL